MELIEFTTNDSHRLHRLFFVFAVYPVICGMSLCLIGAVAFGADISDVKAIYKPDANSFEVTGQADCPDGAAVYATLNYFGDRLLTDRTAVKDKKFFVTLASKAKLLATYYDAEITLNRRDPMPLAVCVAVGTPAAIDKERDNTLTLLHNAVEKSRLFYVLIMNYYEKYCAGEDIGIDDWNTQTKGYKEQLKRYSKTLAERKETYLVVIFPEMESRATALLDETYQIYDELTASLKNKGPMLDIHTGQKLKPEDVRKLFDERFYSQHKPLFALVQLHECLATEYQVIKELRELWALYQELAGQYDNVSLPKAGQPENWLKFSEEWIKKAGASKSRLQEQIKNLDEFKRLFPEFHTSLAAVADTLTNLHQTYDAHLKSVTNPPNPEAPKYQETVKKTEQEFKDQLTGILDQLNWPHLITVR